MHAHTHTTKSRRINDEIEELKREDRQERIKEASPEGRPANPLMRMKDIFWLVIGSAVAILVISAASLILWGFAVGAVVFAFGLLLAVLANPIIWAVLLRGKEAEEVIVEERDDDGPF